MSQKLNTLLLLVEVVVVPLVLLAVAVLVDIDHQLLEKILVVVQPLNQN